MACISKYLEPRFSRLCLRDLTRLTIQQYFSGMAGKVSHPTISKIRDTLCSILRAAVDVDYLIKSPMEGLRLPLDKRARQPKPTITPEQFHELVELVPEPYATMLYVSVWTGLRVSELIGLKWRCIHADSITVEERYCRGDWSVPKTACQCGNDRRCSRSDHSHPSPEDSHRGSSGRAGDANHKLVKSDGPDDLVFQSVQQGKPMNDQNVFKRHIQPAARKLGLSFVNWRCLRTSHATWLVQAGADPKVRPRPDAALSRLDHDGHLRSDRSCRATPSARTAANLPRMRVGCTVQFTVHYGPIKRVFP